MASEAGKEGRVVMAEIPLVVPPALMAPIPQTPQKKIDDFWKKFTTKAPGKGS